MANKFTILVKTQGFDKLERDYKKSNEAAKDFDNTQGRLRGSTSGLRRSIGALRNSFLLYTFAVAGGVKATSNLLQTAARFESLKTRLVGLTGSVNNAEKAFNNFNQVAATTPFSLDDVVEAGAQLQAFGADANALIKPVTDLAAFMGTTASEAANALGRALAGGQGSADILRERGILALIKDSQGLTDLSKTTLPQFREALINTLQDPVVGIAGSTDRLSKTFTGATSNMMDSFTRLSAATGNALINFLNLQEKITSISTVVGNFAERINLFNDPLGTLRAEIEKLGLSTENLDKLAEALKDKEVKQAVRDNNIEIERMARQIQGMGVEEFNQLFTDIAPSALQMSDAMRSSGGVIRTEFTASLLEVKMQALAAKAELEKTFDTLKSRKEITEVTQQLSALQEILDKLTPEEEKEIPIPKVDESEVDKEGEKLDKLDEFMDRVDKARQDLEDRMSRSVRFNLLDDAPLMFEEFMTPFQDLIDMGERFGTTQSEFIEPLEDIQTDNIEFFNDQVQRLADELDGLDTTKQDRAERMKAALQAEAAALTDTSRAFRQISDNIGLAVVQGQSFEKAVVNAIEAIAAKIAAEAVSFAILRLINPGTTATQFGFKTLASLPFFKHDGGPIQKFATGGMVSGGDNVPILAQAGEYVIKRDSAQQIGLDKLNEINETGQTGSLTVNVSAPLVDETVIDSIIPAIQKASRFNLA
jgi:uncharacterized protein YukE